MRARELELRHGHRGEAAQVADREVDLAEQEHEDDAKGEHAGAGELDDDVVEVVGGEEVRRLEAEEEDDEGQADDDRQDAEVAGPDVVESPAGEALRRVLLRCGGRGVLPDDLGLRLGHGVAPELAGMPETFVVTPAVIASTTS